MATITESIVEDAALQWLAAEGWQIAHGLASPQIQVKYPPQPFNKEEANEKCMVY